MAGAKGVVVEATGVAAEATNAVVEATGVAAEATNAVVGANDIAVEAKPTVAGATGVAVEAKPVVAEAINDVGAAIMAATLCLSIFDACSFISIKFRSLLLLRHWQTRRE